MPGDNEARTWQYQREQGEAGLEAKADLRWSVPAENPAAAPVLEQKFYEKYTGEYVWRAVPTVVREAKHDA